MPEFDHTPGAERREDRLRTDLVAWLGTTRPDGRPHLVPVWFLWTRTELIVTAEPGSRKVRNLRANPAVSFALDDSHGGREPVILEGIARLEDANADDPDLVAFYTKYRAELARMRWPEAEARADYRQVIRIEITRTIAF